jgi:hypothetical protein
MSEERQEAWATANRWLEGRSSAFVDLVPGDPDCAGCVLARSYLRALDKIARMTEMMQVTFPDPNRRQAELADKWPPAVQ